MRNDIKFVISGILVVLVLIAGNRYLDMLMDYGANIQTKVMLTVIYFAVLIIGLKLISDVLVKK